MVYMKMTESRKDLVKRLEELTGIRSVYTRMPECAFVVGSYKVEKNGTLVVEDDADQRVINTLLEEGLIKPLTDTPEENPVDTGDHGSGGYTPAGTMSTPQPSTSCTTATPAAPAPTTASTAAIPAPTTASTAAIPVPTTPPAEGVSVATTPPTEAVSAPTPTPSTEPVPLPTDCTTPPTTTTVRTSSAPTPTPEAEQSVVDHGGEQEPRAVAGPEAAGAMCTITLPLVGHVPNSLLNLVNMIRSRAGLLSKATGGNFSCTMELPQMLATINDMPTFLKTLDEHKEELVGLSITEAGIAFTGFPATPDNTTVFMQLATLMNRMALMTKRVIPKPVTADNEKYIFRIWLIRIGMNGAEYAEARKVLLAPLAGNAAFKDQAMQERWKEKRRAEAPATTSATMTTPVEGDEAVGGDEDDTTTVA